MELKVWVDGIQRVVCGANYNTTCQDVVLALAYAMGRTGRFTLVEKWRDTERPLTPGECPLQSLHKWGEYAAEVRFYLVQAETEKVRQQEQSYPKRRSAGGKMETFSSNLASPKSPHHLYPQGTETIKRSSTFSGAHNLNYTNPNSFPSSSHIGRNQQYPSGPPPASSSNSKFRRTALGPMPNGEKVGMSSTSSSNSSPRLSPRGQSSAHMSRAQPYSGDARELHPANMPGASSSYYNQGVDHSSQRQPPPQYPYPASSHQAYPSSSQQPHSKASNSQQPSMSDYPPSSHASFPPSSQPPQSAQQRYPSSQQDKMSSSRQPISENRHFRTSGHPVPAPRHHIHSPESVEYENLPSHARDKPLLSPKKERSGEKVQRNIPRPDQTSHFDAQKDYDSQRTRGDPNQKMPDYYGHPNVQGGGNDLSHFNRFEMGDTEREYFEQFKDKSERVPHDYPGSFNNERNAQGRPRTSDANSFPSRNIPGSYKSSSLEDSRPFPQPQISKGLPVSSRSGSDGGSSNGMNSGSRTSEDQQLSKSMPAPGVNQLHRSGDKISFVDSALKKQQRSSVDNSDRRVTLSSFASAVAHVRQHSGDEKLKLPKSDPHVRQHSSDSSQTESSFKPRLGQGQARPPGANSVQTPGSNLSYHDYPHQPEYHHNLRPSDFQPSPSFPSISSSRQNSAFTEVSPRTSRQSSMSSPPQAAPVAYNLDNQNLDQYRQSTNSIGQGHSNLISQENAHSRQASLEIEEYDLDQNFPDVFQRDAANSGGGAKRSGMPLEYRLETGVAPSQSEAEYMQLMRLVKMQQERLKMQEAQIKDADLEISTLEEQESANISKLDVITVEASQLEKEEAKLKMEIKDLEKVEWVNVLDGEQKREADIKLQMKNLKEKMEVVESEVTQLKEEEEKKSKELQAEKSKIEAEKQRSHELERKTDAEIAQLREKVNIINKQVDEKEKKMKDIEGMIHKADGDIKKQEEEAQKIEEELTDENMKDFQAHPVPKEPPPISVANHSTPLPAAVSTFSTPDSGEAILKILEGRLSPRPSPTAAPGDKKGITTVQQTYKSAMAVKNPNGVWV